MRIIHVCPGYYSFREGNQIHMKKISEYLAAKGDFVQIFTTDIPDCKRGPSDKPTKISYHDHINGILVRRFSAHSKIAGVLKNFVKNVRGGYRIGKVFLGNALEVMLCGPIVPAMTLAIARTKPDIVMVLNIEGALAFFVYLARKIVRFSFVVIP